MILAIETAVNCYITLNQLTFGVCFSSSAHYIRVEPEQRLHVLSVRSGEQLQQDDPLQGGILRAVLHVEDILEIRRQPRATRRRP